MNKKKKIAWGLGILLVLLAIVSVIFYYYAVNNAEKSLASLVETQSGGKLVLKVAKVKIELSKMSFNFSQPVLQTKDSLNNVTDYYIKADNISIKLSSVLKFIFKMKVVAESVIINQPEIIVVKRKADSGKKISLTTEMGLVYTSLENVLKVVEINYLHINNATIELNDKTKVNSSPIIANNLFLTITRTSLNNGSNNTGRLLFTDNIQFDAYNQHLVLKDGNGSVDYKHLSISSGNKYLKLDSCHFSMSNGNETGNKFDIQLDSIHIVNVDYDMLLKDGLLMLDTAICYKPKINLQIELAENRKRSDLIKDSLLDKEAVENYFKKVLGDIDIGYLAVSDARLNVVTFRNKKSSSYASKNINISFTNLAVIDKPDVPLKLDKFALAIKDYTAYTPDSVYAVKFDSVVVEKQKIALTNFTLKPKNTNHKAPVKSVITKSFEINQINWNELIYNQKLQADNITLIKPDVTLALPEPELKGDTIEKNKKESSFDFLREKIKITNLFLNDGSVKVDIGSVTSASVNNCFLKIKVHNLLTENSIENIVASVEDLSFSGGNYSNKKSVLEVAGFSYKGVNGNLNIEKLKQVSNDRSAKFEFDGIALQQIQLKRNMELVVGNLGWRSADIAINKTQKEHTTEQKQSKSKFQFKLLVNHLDGGLVDFNLISQKLNFSAKLNSMKSGELSAVNDEMPVINNLLIDGRSLAFNQKKIQVTSGAFIINDRQAGSLKNVKMNLETATELVKMKLPELGFSIDINSCLNGNLKADYITINRPEFSFEPVAAATTVSNADKKPLPKFQVGRIELNEPYFINHPKSISDKMKVVLGSGNLQINSISSDGEAIAARDLHLKLRQFGFSNGKIKIDPIGNESLQVDASDFVFNTTANNSANQWRINLDTIIVSNIIAVTSSKQPDSSREDNFNKGKIRLQNPYTPVISKSDFHLSDDDKSLKNQLSIFNDSLAPASIILRELNKDTTKQTISITRLELENINLNSENGTEIKKLLANNHGIKIKNSTITIQNSKSIINLVNLNFDSKNKELKMDHFGFEPSVNQETFMLTKTVQTSYMKLNMGKLKANGFDVHSFINDDKILVKNLNADSVFLYIYKDKRLPYNMQEKPMLTELIGRIPMKINLDTVNLTRANIEYCEINDKTLLNGCVVFNDLKGRILNVKNYNVTATDSLKFKVSSQFMNATTLKVNYAQSYHDTLAAFTITVHISPFDLTKLNPLLGPTVSAKVNSGYLDTISMIAIGRRHVSLGEMKMYYRDLNIEFLDKGSEDHKTLKTRVVTLLADAVVKNNNSSGTGEVYAERVYDKGFPSYWLRILLSGVMTNTGIRTNKKQEKKYYDSIKKYKVPPIGEVNLD